MYLYIYICVIYLHIYYSVYLQIFMYVYLCIGHASLLFRLLMQDLGASFGGSCAVLKRPAALGLGFRGFRGSGFRDLGL